MQRDKRIVWAKAAVILLTVPILIWAYAEGPDAGFSGVPNEFGNCTYCHTGAVNSGGGSVAVQFPNGLTYSPGVKQHLTVIITDPVQQRWGFQLTARVAGSPQTQAGIFNPTDAYTQVMCADTGLTQEQPTNPCPAGLPLEYIEHNLTGYQHTQASPATYSFDWTPPAGATGNIAIYVAGNAANGDGSNQGDHIYTASYTLTPQSAGGGGPPPATPSISQNGVINGASFQPGISASSWVTIQGSNLSTTTRTWRADEIQNGVLPTSLDGVSVTIDNQPAAVYYISPTQINVLAPADQNLGPVSVVVTNSAGTSNTATAQLQSFSPAFFVWPGNHVVATRPDFTYVGPAGLFQGLTTTPAKPGDVIVLWGSGFGLTNPAVPGGQAVPSNEAPAVTTLPSITVGGVAANVVSAVLSPGLAGLYQVAITVPDPGSDGDFPVVATINGIQSPNTILLAIHH